MLLQFSAKNYACFKDKIVFSLIASNADKRSLEDSNVFELPKFSLRLLKSAAIYGANASGKSKLFDAVEFMRKFVLNSAKESHIKDPVPYNPFRLHTDTESAPIELEVVFVYQGALYRYGFESTNRVIVGEWLFRRTKTKEVALFNRDYQKIDFHKTAFKVKDLVENERIRPNALMLSVAANWNNPVAVQVFEWFASVNLLDAKDENQFQGFSLSEVEQGNKQDIITFLRAGGIHIADIKITKTKAQDIPVPDFLRNMLGEDEMLVTDILFAYKKYGQRKRMNEQISLFGTLKDSSSDAISYENEFLSLMNDESSGTKQLFALAGPILDTLRTGKILFIDELESKLHPKLTKMIVSLFNSKESNPLAGQLIFNTHNTNLLDLSLLRRDQIWLVEKNKFGASSLYSLSDIKGIRHNEPSIRKKYMVGKYGGTPAISQTLVDELILSDR